MGSEEQGQGALTQAVCTADEEHGSTAVNTLTPNHSWPQDSESDILNGHLTLPLQLQMLSHPCQSLK